MVQRPNDQIIKFNQPTKEKVQDLKQRAKASCDASSASSSPPTAVPVYSYQLNWSFCIENDILSAKTDAEMKTKLFDMTIEDKKKRGPKPKPGDPKPKDKTGKKPFKDWEDHPGGNKDDDDNGDDSGCDGTGADGGSGVATENAGDDNGFISDDDTRTRHYFTVLKVQQILREYRSAASVSGDASSSISSPSSGLSGPKAVEIGLDKCDDGFVGLRNLVQQVAMDPDLFTALAESDNNDLLDDLSEVLAAVENSGGDDADEACDNFDAWRASDNAEINGEEFDKREREVIASAEVTCRL